MHLDLQLYYAPSIFVFPQTIFFSWTIISLMNMMAYDCGSLVRLGENTIMWDTKPSSSQKVKLNKICGSMDVKEDA